MGSCCTKNQNNVVARGNKLSEIRSNLIHVRKNNKNETKIDGTTKELLTCSDSKLRNINPKRNFFYVIQKRTWIVILDFLTYKDLCQAGQLNK
jgi:hypothetical protein